MFAFQSLFCKGSLLTNVEKEMYLCFIITSRNDENDTISKETRGLYARGNMLLTIYIQTLYTRCKEELIYWHSVPRFTVAQYGQPMITH